MKRRSDYGKWKDARHRKLTLLEKVVYDYLWDNCSQAGFFKLSDTDADAFKVGCGPDQYTMALANLTKPKPTPGGGTPHRGFVRVNGCIWISHFVIHDQDSFGQSANNAHKPIVRELVSHTEFHNEPEFQKVLNMIEERVYEAFDVRKPGFIPSTKSESSVVQATIDDQKGDKQFDINEIVSQFCKITGKKVTLNRIIERNIMDRAREGVVAVDMFKVFRFKHKEWGEDAKMKSNVTMETLLSEKFHQYLNQANNDTSGSDNVYRRPGQKKK